MIASILNAWRQWRAYRRTRAALDALSPDLMTDLGIDPRQVGALARKAAQADGIVSLYALRRQPERQTPKSKPCQSQWLKPSGFATVR